MAVVTKEDRDSHLRAVIKSNLVCGDITDLEKIISEIMKDIVDVLDAFENLQEKQ